MPGAGSSDMSAMGSIGTSLSSSQDSLATLTQQIKQRDSSKVQTFQAYTRDVAKETLTDARYIGDLRPNQNRLNTFTLSTRDDPDDNYRFNLRFTGKVHLSLLVDQLDAQRHVIQSETAKGLGVQVIQYLGSSHKVIADSDPAAGPAKKMYDQLAGDGAELTRGKYVVRVYRQSDASPQTDYFYSFQLSGGRYYQDYDTQEQEAEVHPRKSLLEFLKINPAVMLMADSVDATMGTAMVAASRPPTLVTNTDSSVDPVTQLLDAFM
jgi:hypothetical protein